MATMIPSDIGEFETEGGKTFYKFLEGVATQCWSGRVNGNHVTRRS
jgi:hypothetical protein